MLRFNKRITKSILGIGILGLAVSIFLFIWSISIASLRCVYCDCSFSIFAENSHCRFPSILNLISLLLFGVSLILLIISGLSFLQNRKFQTLK